MAPIDGCCRLVMNHRLQALMSAVGDQTAEVAQARTAPRAVALRHSVTSWTGGSSGSRTSTA
jgi:hypothetical protein